MRRILFLGRYMYPDFVSGVEVTMYEFAKYLQSKQVEIGIAASSLSGYFHYPELANFTMFRVQGVKSRNPARRLLHMLSVARAIFTFQPDLILAFGVFDYVLPALIYAKLFRKKVVVYTESTFCLIYFLRKLIYRHADQILCVSPTHIPTVKQFGPKRDPIFLASGTHPAPVDLVARASKDHFQIFSVGRLSPEKNLSTLITSIGFITQKHPNLPKNIQLDIAGEGSEETNLKHLASELALDRQVTFLGRVSRDEINDLYAAADVFVLPSIYEGFPLVIADALGYSCPIVCSKIPALTAILHEPANCLFFSPPRSSESLADAIFQILVDDNLRNQMQQNNSLLGQQYTWEVLGNALWRVLKQNLR